MLTFDSIKKKANTVQIIRLKWIVTINIYSIYVVKNNIHCGFIETTMSKRNFKVTKN